MTATTMTLTEFLRARLDEDERRANNWWRLRKEFVGREVRRDSTMPHGIVWVDGEEMLHGDVYERRPQRRELAEVEAKRRIMERCAAVGYAMPSTHLAHGILAELALPYADHPDYRDAWRQ